LDEWKHFTSFYKYYEGAGEGGYWEGPDFASLGDAYDEVVGNGPLDRADYLRSLSWQASSLPLRDEGSQNQH
jgi:hypothetical protein